MAEKEKFVIHHHQPPGCPIYRDRVRKEAGGNSTCFYKVPVIQEKGQDGTEYHVAVANGVMQEKGADGLACAAPNSMEYQHRIHRGVETKNRDPRKNGMDE